MVNKLYNKIAEDAIAVGYQQEMDTISKEAGGWDKAMRWLGKNVKAPVKTFIKSPKAAFEPKTVRALGQKPEYKALASLAKGNKEEAKTLVGMMQSDVATNREALKGLAIVAGGAGVAGGTGLAIANRPRRVRVVE